MLPKPDINLEVGSGSHGAQTGKMLIAIERELVKTEPALTLVVGDTNSTLAGALASAKLKIPIAHVEAGARSDDFYMPEEINRRLVDQVSELLFTPTENATRNLLKEGVAKERIHCTGDLMYDALLWSTPSIGRKKCVARELGVSATQEYAVLTLHRENNVDDANNFRSILDALSRIDVPIIFPMHPRACKNIKKHGLTKIIDRIPNLIITEPLGYFEFLSLLCQCSLVLTDSGGVQKEAFLLRKPCLTLRDKTEWIETVVSGANVLVGTDTERIVEEANERLRSKTEISWKENPFGDGKASQKIVTILEKFYLSSRRSSRTSS